MTTEASMTPAELTALAAALAEYAESPDRVSYQAEPILRAADYLRTRADAVPVAWLLRSKTRRNTDGDLFIRGCYGTPRTKQDYEFAELDGDEYIELVAHPAPAAPQAEPETFESELRSFAETPEQVAFVEKLIQAEPKRPSIEVTTEFDAIYNVWRVTLTVDGRRFFMNYFTENPPGEKHYAGTLWTASGITGDSDADR